MTARPGPLVSDLTPRQRFTLIAMGIHDRVTPRYLGVRRDVLWRMQERGLVTRSLHDEWSLTTRGRELLDTIQVGPT